MLEPVVLPADGSGARGRFEAELHKRYGAGKIGLKRDRARRSLVPIAAGR